MIASVEALFNSIEAKRVANINATSTMESIFSKRLDRMESTAGELLNRAREDLLRKTKDDQMYLLNRLDRSNMAQFTSCTLDLEDSCLFNYDEINPQANFSNLLDFVKYVNLHRLRLNEINFTEHDFTFRVNFISVLAVGKVFIDLNWLHIDVSFIPIRPFH